jgi:hypothetical protein
LGAPKLADRVNAHIKSVMSRPISLTGHHKSNSKGEKREANNPEPVTIEP